MADEMNKERKAFEAWITKDGGDLSTFGTGAHQHYRNSAVNNAWVAWKARASIAASAGSEKTMDEAFDCARAALLQCPDRASVRAVLDTLRARVEKAMWATSAGSEPVAPDQQPMPETWSVVASVHGERILSIGESWVSGKGELTEAETKAVIGMAQHLLSFVGYGLPPSSFDPDADDAALTHPSPPEGAGWISVDERLPELYKRVLVITTDCDDDPYATPAHYNGPGKFLAAGGHRLEPVTHW